jgi:hypothetical protein
MTATDMLGAARSNEFVIGYRPQGGTLDDTTRPDGLGKTSEDQSSTSDQPIKVPTSFTRKKK